MDGRAIPATAAVTFGSAAEAELRIAGVAAAARIVRELAEAGFAEVWLAIPDSEKIGPQAMDDIRRLAGSMVVRIGAPGPGAVVASLPGNQLIPAEAIHRFLADDPGALDGALRLDRGDASMEILRRTGKAADGPVSRWLNRPVSRRISALLLHLPGARPIHATAGTAALALTMFFSLVAGGAWGLVAGGLLFHAASIFDGVDGEIARATFRSSQAGAALDTSVDIATNMLFILGLAIHIGLRGQAEALMLAGWGLSLFLLGLALIGGYAIRTRGPFSLNRVKTHYRRRATTPIVAGLISFLTLVSSRDFFALLFALLIVAGLPMGPLYIFAAAASVWILFVIGSLVPPRKPKWAAESAEQHWFAD